MKFLSDILAKAGLVVDGVVTLNSVANATTDTDKFVVLDSGVVRYRTGAEVLSDIGAQPLLTNPVTGVGSAGQVAFYSGASTITGDSSLYWDNTNKRLGVGTTAPYSSVQIGSGSGAKYLGIVDTADATYNIAYIGHNGTKLNIGFSNSNTSISERNAISINSSDLYVGIGVNAPANRFQIGSVGSTGFSGNTFAFGNGTAATAFFQASTSTQMYLSTYLAILSSGGGTGNVVIGALASNGFRLEVVGTMKVTSTVTLDTIANATTDTDKFLVSDGGVIKYRTGAEILSDIGAQGALTNPVTGTGTTSYVTRWTGTNTVGTGVLYDDGTHAGVGTTSLGNFNSVSLTGPFFDVAGVLQIKGTSANTVALLQFGGDTYRKASIYSTIASQTPALVFNVGNSGISSVVNEAMRLLSTLQVKFAGYTSSSSFTGTAAGILGFDSSGNVITLSSTLYPSGSGTTNYITKFTGASTVGNSQVFDNGISVGFGTASPNASYRVDVVGSLRVGDGSSYNKLTINGNSGAGSYLNFQKNGTNKGDIGPYSAVLGGAADDLTYLSVAGHYWSSGATVRMNLTTGGNLGLGVTPSAWLSTLNALQIGAAHLFGQTTGTGTVSLGNNAYLNSTPAYIYQYNGKATRYSQYDGQHEWYTAGTGTAGNAISFTQAMTLDASGNLLLGTTTVGETLTVYKSSGAAALFQNSTTGTGSTKGLYVGNTGGDGYIWNYTAHNLILATNNAERVRITSAGNVGIGSVAPAVKLEVNGDIAVANGSYVSFASNSPTTTRIYRSGGMLFENSGYQMLLNDSGVFGVGLTSNLRGKLDVGGIAVVGNGTSGVSTEGIRFSRTGDDYRYQSIFTTSGGSAAANLMQFNLHNVSTATSQTTVMTLRGDGNVGIGTASPANLLHLYGTDGNSYLRWTSDVATTGTRIGYNGTEFRIDQQQNADITFRTNLSEKMRITSGGFVGIGTASPQYSLDSTGVINSTGFGTFLGFSTPVGRTFNYVTSFGSGTTINYPGTGTAGFQYNYFANNEFYTTAGGTSNLLVVGFRNQNYIRSTVSTVPFQMVGFNNRFDMHDANDLATLGILNTVNGSFLREATASPLGGITTAHQFTTTTRLRSGFYTTTRWGNENLQVADTTASQASSITDYDFLLNTTNVGSSSGGPGTITNFYLLRHVTNIGATGTITNRWGLYLTDSSFTSYHAGNFLLGTSTSAGNFKLQVTGSTYLNGNVSIGTTYNGFALNVAGTAYMTSGSVWVTDGYGYSHASTTTGMFPDSGHNITFRSNNSSVVYIKSGGDVGIGTTSPTSQANYRFLQVNGTQSAIIETMVGGTRIGGFDSDSSNLYVGTIGSYPIVFRTAVVERMRILTTGQLKLANYTSSSAFSGTAAGYLGFDSSGNIITVAAAGGVSGSGTTNYVARWTSSSALGTGVLYDNGTNTSINTSSPVSTNLVGALTIWKTYNSDGGSVPSTTAQNYYENQSGLYVFGRNSTITLVGANSENNEIFFANASSRNYAVIGTFTGTTTAGGDMYFRTGGNNEAMRITTGGNVGIGTTSPSYKLDVNGSSGFRGDMYVFSNSTYWYNGTTYFQAINSSNVGILKMTNNSSPISLQPNGGNVLIGTTTDAGYTLDVNGNGRMNGSLFLNGTSSNNLYLGQASGTGANVPAIYSYSANGTYYWSRYVDNTGLLYWVYNATVRMQLGLTGNLTIGGTLTENSSIRWKENIQDLSGSLDKVEKLRGVSYNKKGDTATEIGLIAEEVEEVYPEFVEYDQSGKPVGLHYTRLTAVLIESVKQLKKRIEDLENRN